MGKHSNARRCQQDGPDAGKKIARASLLAVLAARPAPVATARGVAAQQIAVALGLSVDAVRALIRECCEIPADALMDRQLGEVVALPSGLEKVRAAVAARMAPTPPAAKASAPVLVVVKIHGPKRLLADVEGANPARRVLCCLQRAEHFMQGMKLEGAAEGEGGLWHYQGRLPRRKGVW